MSVEIERGKAVGVMFDGMQTPGEGLARAAKLPRLQRATYRGASLSAAAIRPLAAAAQLTEITIDAPISTVPDETFAALVEVKSLRKLTLRGVEIGEDAEDALKKRLPRVDVVLERPLDKSEDSTSAAATSDEVQSVW